jgi:hypothetical protein
MQTGRWIVIVFILVGVGAGITLPEKAAVAQQPPEQRHALVCYAWSAFPNERLKLNVLPHSPLSEPEEERTFQHPAQTAYSVHGKEIGGCGGNTMTAVTGTVVTAKQEGAHMGLVAHFSRGTGQFFGSDSCRSITFDCTTKEDNPAPDSWECHSRNEFDVYHGLSTLRKVDETQDPRCSIFQNGSFADVTAQEQRVPTSSATIPDRPGISSGAPADRPGALSQLRLGRRLTEPEACYFGCRGAGAADLICRFFCDLRPFTIGGLLIPE